MVEGNYLQFLDDRDETYYPSEPVYWVLSGFNLLSVIQSLTDLRHKVLVHQFVLHVSHFIYVKMDATDNLFNYIRDIEVIYNINILFKETRKLLAYKIQ